MTQEEREANLRAFNEEITNQLSKPSPNQEIVAALRKRRDEILSDYVAAGGTNWYGNA